MITSLGMSSMLAGEKEHQSIGLHVEYPDLYGLEVGCNLREIITDIEFALKVYSGTNNTIFESLFIIENTQAASRNLYYMPEDILVDEEGMKISAEFFESSLPFGGGTAFSRGIVLIFFVENDTDREVEMSVSSTSVNDISTDFSCSSIVYPGKKRLAGLNLLNSRLDELGVEEIDSLAFQLVVLDTESEELILDYYFTWGTD